MTDVEPSLKTKLLIAGLSTASIDVLIGQLSPYPFISIVGSVTDIDAALGEVARRKPDIVLAELSGGDTRALELARRVRGEYPQGAVIILADQSSLSFFQQAMLVGASAFLVRPLSSEELAKNIDKVRRVQREWVPASLVAEEAAVAGKLVTVCGIRGGVGKTLVSVNLAALLAPRVTGGVVLLDLNLQFGDVDLFLNLKSDRTIKSLHAVMRERELRAREVDAVLCPAGDNLKVLLAPVQPEEAAGFTAEDLASLIAHLKSRFAIIVADSAAYVTDVLLATLRAADLILVIGTPDLAGLRDTAKFLRLLERLGHTGDRVALVLNRMPSGLRPERVQRDLGRPLLASLPEDQATAATLLERGTPSLASDRRPLPQALHALAETVAEILLPEARRGPAAPKTGR